MATRPRTSSNGKKKSSAPPVLNDIVDEPSQDAAPAGMAEESVAEVTRTKLEEREIPSFSESREARIAEAAYWRAERRGFQPGRELDDWLEAERSIDGDDEQRTPE